MDLFGITHPGHKRADNQDHFLIGTVHPETVVHGSSLPGLDKLPLRGGRFGTVLLVADGVGGATDGGAAARVATESVVTYVSNTLRCYLAEGAVRHEQFVEHLRDAALQAHDAVRAEAAARSGSARLATTLTLGFAVYPWLYLVQVGDSRAYVYSHGVLHRLTRDQTMADDLAAMGALKPQDVDSSPLKHRLTSTIGGEDARPETTRVDVSERGCIVLFCTDGLTKHVTDEEIAARCASVRSSEQLSRDLLQLALDRGGTDNITIVVGRAPLRTPNTT